MDTKQITLMDRISQKKKINGRILSFKNTRKDLFKLMPEFDTPAINSMFDNSIVKHILICIYENRDGEMTRRICGLSKESDIDQLKVDAKHIASTLGIDIERAFEIIM